MTAFNAGAATDKGRVREGNEDFLLADDRAGVFIVADGMGGHRGGEIAAHLAVKSLEEGLKADNALTTQSLVEAVQAANDVIVTEAGRDDGLRGMGTTLCALALVNQKGHQLLGVVNVGDSRLYMLQEGELAQVTEDHSLVATLEKQGRLTKAEAAVHPQRNILTRALGIDSQVMVDSWEIRPVVGDRYLLCSDGLFNEVDDSRIAATLRRLADPKEAASELVRLANDGGGRDNITVVIVDIVDGDGDGSTDGSATGTRIVSSSHADDGLEEIDHEADDAEPTASYPVVPGAPAGPPDNGAAEKAEPASGSPASGPSKSGSRRRPRLLTWRTVVFFLVMVAIFGVAAGAIIYTGTQTFHVAFDGQGEDARVVIYRGKPGGVLWIDPEPEGELDPPITRREVQEFAGGYEPALDQGKEQSTLEDAERYATNLRSDIDDARRERRPRPTLPESDTTTTTEVSPTQVPPTEDVTGIGENG
jgi:PPM family protein phosphatase